MHHKRPDIHGDGCQLNLPFEQNDASFVQQTSRSNIVDFFSKLNKNKEKKENDERKRSINRLLDYAEKLNL
jgi:hypothetical protein